MAIYSEKVMEHFMNPRNVGVIEDADGIGEVGNPVCGDMMTFYIKVNGDVLEDVKFQTFGCGAAIAVSSMVSEMAKGKKIEEALEISNKTVAEALGGLPVQKMHCSNLGAEALGKAIENYRERIKLKVTRPAKPKPERKIKVRKEECICPYCDNPTPMSYPFCQTCEAELRFCPECKKPLPQKVDNCPECGAKVSPEVEKV